MSFHLPEELMLTALITSANAYKHREIHSLQPYQGSALSTNRTIFLAKTALLDARQGIIPGLPCLCDYEVYGQVNQPARTAAVEQDAPAFPRKQSRCSGRMSA